MLKVQEGNRVIQDLGCFMRDPLEKLQNLIGEVKASGMPHFRNTGSQKGERVLCHTNITSWWQGAQELVLSVKFSIDAASVKTKFSCA